MGLFDIFKTKTPSTEPTPLPVNKELERLRTIQQTKITFVIKQAEYYHKTTVTCESYDDTHVTFIINSTAITLFMDLNHTLNLLQVQWHDDYAQPSIITDRVNLIQGLWKKGVKDVLYGGDCGGSGFYP